MRVMLGCSRDIGRADVRTLGLWLSRRRAFARERRRISSKMGRCEPAASRDRRTSETMRIARRPPKRTHVMLLLSGAAAAVLARQGSWLPGSPDARLQPRRTTVSSTMRAAAAWRSRSRPPSTSSSSSASAWTWMGFRRPAVVGSMEPPSPWPWAVQTSAAGARRARLRPAPGPHQAAASRRVCRVRLPRLRPGAPRRPLARRSAAAGAQATLGRRAPPAPTPASVSPSTEVLALPVQRIQPRRRAPARAGF